jgi:S-adenosylhomocysteine hydrolase
VNGGGSARRLYAPRRVEVETAGDVPRAVAGVAVEAMREQWRVEDRWWTERPVLRSYFELVLVDGRDAVVFLEQSSGRWYRQRA